MSLARRQIAPTKRAVIRAAIYTRKSTEEGLQQEFNSLDAQRESGEAYIASQQHEGWTCLAERFDDGGFSGGNSERPALKRLLAAIRAGQVDCVVVYKVDRLSRSLLDFSRIVEIFDRHQVAFVSVTQQFNTANSMGRLTLNLLLTFAQFEREIISERTRDKMAAARRKGKWVGGMPILGYDVEDSKLIVNAAEAQRVRGIFELYLKLSGLIPTVQELERRGWCNKAWRTKKDRLCGGQPFIKTSLHRLLTNPAYIGRVQYRGEDYAGEHSAIISSGVWARVQRLLKRQAAKRVTVGDRRPDLLRGLLHCQACDRAMIAGDVQKRERRYRYYVCSQAQQRGWHACPTKSIPAGEIERLVIEQLEARWQSLGGEPHKLDQASIRRLVERIDYDGAGGRLTIRFLETPTNDETPT